MKRTANNMKNGQNNGSGEVSRFRGGVAIAACLTIAVTGIVGAKVLLGSKSGSDEGTATGMQAAAQLNKPVSIEQNKPGHSVAHIDITPDEILNMSINELKELSSNEYDIVESKWSPQHECFGYRFAAFPEYVCAFDSFIGADETEFANSENVKFPPDWIEIDPDVDMGNGISAGMTYNEIKERCDGEIYIKFPWRWLVCADVNGKECCFEIEELTDEQYSILGDRLDANEEQDTYGYPITDASDINPATTYGIIFSRERLTKDNSKPAKTTTAKKVKKVKKTKTKTTGAQNKTTKNDSVNEAKPYVAEETKPVQTTTATTTNPVEVSEPVSIEQNKPGHSVAHIDITPDEIFSMSIEELKELSGYEYDIVVSKWSPHHECFGYRFAAFPEYVCAIDAFQNPDENTIIDTYHVKEAPNWIEVDPDVDMGNGISAGMTYNEIKDRCDGEIYIKFPWRWLVCATVNGKQCCFEIEELTDEECGILGDRLDANEAQDTDGYTIADASDIDPTTTYGLIFNR